MADIAGESPAISRPQRRSAEEIARTLTTETSARWSERVIGKVLLASGLLSIATTVGIIFVLLDESVRFFGEVSIVSFLFGTEWTALFKDPKFGVLPLVGATLLISVLSMVVAIPIGLMSAIFLSEYASPRARSFLKPTLELLAGIPTIVYGYFALTFITPVLLKPLVPNVGVYNALSAALAVGIMVVPLVASLSEDALQAVPRALREGGYALGGTRMEVALKVLAPAALSGIVASFILAISRAIGETMIVTLAAGSKPQLTLDPREAVQAMTGYIVQVLSGDVVAGSTVYRSLFAVGLLLFAMTLLMNIISRALVARFREAYE